MQENTTCYWEQKQKQQVIISPTHTILHSCINFVVVKYVNDIPRSVCNRNQAKHNLQRNTICIIESYQYYILGEIDRGDKIENGRNLNGDCGEE